MPIPIPAAAPNAALPEAAWPRALAGARLLGSGLALLTSVAAAQGEHVPAGPDLSYFSIRTADPQWRDRCLEANTPGSGSALDGATLLDRCRPVTGQAWHAEPDDTGGFQLTSKLHGPTVCLTADPDRIEGSPAGVLHMAACPGLHLEAVPAEDGRGFALAAPGGGDCIAARAPDPDAQYGRVAMEACDGTPSQTWMAVGGALGGGIPSAGVRADAARDAECLWNDGTSDRPDHYPCRVERMADGRGFTVIGPGHEHGFVVDPERPDTARGTLRIGPSRIEAGLFERRKDDIACWLNARTSERLCIW